mmetsp:Transcript_71794/g.149994  ORF Transcript_71794/g.149994 Transcript_71794/m.149994 type:complete len:409 (-) Transcript_71794:732-1958(-)|eukprot:CAMPEP_0206493672 /NCGR_PEP_ID=MMETSP0324_2-20121206/47164_1 /ASSEMBLY_ACC=CAM_ASM_000836 /TAXON_ID=2866 /ORGANISM="Crypthecodinium cohnii, Strain Seligo" /LENGTH=408 /DNA_ID=CAMNT_0053976965 /DNA_START=229 /DNA_END=1455 /DNA_ORIENTATION=-
MWGQRRPSEAQAEELKANIGAYCERAADAIQEADVFLLCTGAGFSADSGLAVYADVAQVPAYKERGLKYHDICQSDWLEGEPDLFWGFWGQCFNDYRATAPHEGYEIISRWVEERFRTGQTAEDVKNMIAEVQQRPTEEPYEVDEKPGAFYVFTSNVDAHHFDWFRASEIRECHGNVELYQCAHPGHSDCSGVWRAPSHLGFDVNLDTMLAPDGPQLFQPTPPREEGAEAASDSEAKPRVGHVKGGGRPYMLRYMPECSQHVSGGFSTNYPRCIHCDGPARPAILMFGDGDWLDFDSQESRWFAWTAALESLSTKRQLEGEKLKVVILECGAGNNVPTVRRTSEWTMKKLRKAQADVKLIRVNPELPLGDSTELRPCGEDESRVIPIMSGALAALKKIDEALFTRSFD